MAIGLSIIISPSVVIILVAIPLSMTVSSTIISDKKNKWTQFAITLPVTKKQIISSKYIAYLFWTVLGMLIGTLICYIILKVTNSEDEYINLFMSFSIIISLLSGSFIIPCNFILPEENSLIGTILAYSMTSGVLALFIYVIKKVIGLSNMNLTLLIICSVSSIVYLISWYITQKKIKNFN